MGGLVGGRSVGEGTGVPVGASVGGLTVGVLVKTAIAVLVGGGIVGVALGIGMLPFDWVRVGKIGISVRVGVGERVTVGVYVVVGPVMRIAATNDSVDVDATIGIWEAVRVKKSLANACCVRILSGDVGVAVKRGNNTTSSRELSTPAENRKGIPNAKRHTLTMMIGITKL